MNININMRKITFIASFAFFSLLAMPSKSFALTSPLGDSTEDARIAAKIVERVTEIQNMDIANLTPTEKKELKKELKDMQKKADNNKGVYLSIGAIIIIILLLILLL